MIFYDNNNIIYTELNISKFSELEDYISNLAPSLCEYYVNNLSSSLDEIISFNKSNIQATISVNNNYIFYLDYSENLYLELINTSCDDDTLSLW